MRIISTSGMFGLFAGLNFLAVAEPAHRVIPRPLPSHPGNIFLADEEVILPLPADNATTWQAIDYDGKKVAEGHLKEGRMDFGHLPVGYYEMVGKTGGKTNHISFGVLQPLSAPTPFDSPIGIDVALAWMYPETNMVGVANLCALAGMNRVRDRASWPELQPKPGELVVSNRYDYSLEMQDAAGLQVLDVNHISAPWANPNSKHMPPDLRTAYDFYRRLAQRWQGKIAAFEPWNEGDLAEFGGHTGNELASFQKAAYLGLKAGNSNLIICDAVFGIHRQTTLRNFNENKAWPYFDTFNLHHYEPLPVYPKLYEDFREVSAGKPLWVTECNVTVEWSGDENLKEPNAENLRLQSERVAKIYSKDMHEGAEAVFYFMLPQYTERQQQFGLLHADMTPRPAFLAAAAAGRLFVGAKPLGSLNTPDKSVQGFAFKAKPDGKAATVLVIWSEHETKFQLAGSPAACFDHLGREHPIKGNSVKLTSAPLYLILTENAYPSLIPPPKRAELLSGKPSPIVLQALLPEQDIVMTKSAYKIAADRINEVPVFVYNFGSQKIHGKLQVSAPEHWTTQFPEGVDIEPGERKELILKLGSVHEWTTAARVRISGSFGSAGTQTLALRFTKTEE